MTEFFGRGGEGGLELARAVEEVCEGGEVDFRYLYELEAPLDEKLRANLRVLHLRQVRLLLVKERQSLDAAAAVRLAAKRAAHAKLSKSDRKALKRMREQDECE